MGLCCMSAGGGAGHTVTGLSEVRERQGGAWGLSGDGAVGMGSLSGVRGEGCGGLMGPENPAPGGTRPLQALTGPEAGGVGAMELDQQATGPSRPSWGLSLPPWPCPPTRGIVAQVQRGTFLAGIRQTWIYTVLGKLP